MSRRGWALFLAMSMLWGVPYLLIKVALEELSPASLVLLRCALSAAVLLPWALARGEVRPVLRHWKPLLLFTALEMTGPWLLLAYAEQSLSSSLTGLLIALVPIVAAIAGRLAGEQDRFDAVRLFGMVLGILGVGAVLGLDLHGGQAMAVAAVALVVLGYGTAPLVVTRSLSGVPSTGISAVALGLTSLVYLPRGLPPLVLEPLPTARVVVAVLLLALVCTVAALLLFFALIREVGPNRALAITFVNPAVAVLAGIVVLSEPLTGGMLVGFPLILLGCVLATRHSRPRHPDPPAQQPLAEPVSRS
ncbi:MAG: cyeA [Frankiales bacterium]|nr:cyeA [Frankiales bacterium]